MKPTTPQDFEDFVRDIANLTDEQLTYETPMIGSFRDEARRLLKHQPTTTDASLKPQAASPLAFLMVEAGVALRAKRDRRRK